MENSNRIKTACYQVKNLLYNFILIVFKEVTAL